MSRRNNTLNTSADQLKTLFDGIRALDADGYQQFRAGFARIDKQRREEAVFDFHVGDIVQFPARGRIVTIKIAKIGRARLRGPEIDPKTKGAPAFPMNWRVSATLVTRVTS